MASSFPGAIDNFTDPLTTSTLNSPSHAGQHQDLNDAVEKIETYMGLVKVIPTSVSSAGGTAATLAANGTVTIGTSNTSVSVNGCFTNQYLNYRAVIRVTGQSTTQTMRLQMGSSTASYFNSGITMGFVASTVTGYNDNSTTIAQIGTASSSLGNWTCIIDFLAPVPVARSFFSYQSGAPGGLYIGVGQVGTDTSHTGFTLSPNTGTWTGGQITVYGYRD